ncbi:MAG TPA: hypothetical protein VGD50_08325 [Candidatus Baltobacteraceae bacterium]
MADARETVALIRKAAEIVAPNRQKTPPPAPAKTTAGLVRNAAAALARSRRLSNS